jgi:seryl-tRNA synthetase
MASEFLNDLFNAGILIPLGEDGVYGRSAVFEAVVEGLTAAALRSGKDQKAEKLRFPPATTFAGLKKSGYLESFPQLAGTVHCFCGNDRDHRALLQCIGEDDDSWTAKQQVSGVALTPAACYPVYPVMAKRGVVPEQGYVVDAFSYCFRHEPSIDPMRMQLFRMQEFIRIGTPEQVETFRNMWMKRGQDYVASLQLPYEVDVANDPFFGRGGQIMADAQREQKLKFELLIPVNPDKLSACLSFNYHMDHFGEIYEMHTADGQRAHTACVGFGLERLTLAMLKHHGFDLDAWPGEVQNFLWPNGRE